MNLENLIANLQKKPYETRVKILWGTVSILAILIFAIWLLSLKSTLNGFNAGDLTKSATSTVDSRTQTKSSYVQVERVENTSTTFKIYFNFTNPTNDILNVSKSTDISLAVNDQTLNPKQIIDRQGQAFVQKILSHAQNFGILVFDSIKADAGTLTFNQMFLEQNPGQFLSQKLELNFKELEKTTNLRN